MRYYIQPTREGDRPDAGVKAVADAYTILDKMGYKPIKWRSRWPIHAMKYIAEKNLYLRLQKQIKPDDTILLQWPDYSIKYHRSLFDILKNHEHVQILIHDINSLREFGTAEMMENEFFCMAETLIVHTHAMKEYVCSLGVNPSNVKILTSFDYLTDDAKLPERRFSHNVVYAGNLQKSTFLKAIDNKVFQDNTSLNCYGRNADNLGDKCLYKGVFSSEHVVDIEGSWGLVWDGDSVDTCSGIWGHYLRYNSPHKLSLYVVAGLPIIIWKESALAGYVKDNNLGLLVDSLSEIPHAIASITEEDYSLMLRNVQAQRDMLLQGKHLATVLEKGSDRKRLTTEQGSLVSVIIPGYNHAPYLRKRINSVLEQDYENYEVIMLDDCSNDNSREIMQEYANDFKAGHLMTNARNIAFYPNEKNSGNTFKQWEHGVSLAKGEYIWIAESDDVAKPQFLSTLMEKITGDENAVLAFSYSNLIGPEGLPFGLNLDEEKRYKAPGVYNGWDFCLHRLAYKNMLYNASMIVFRKKYFGRVTDRYKNYRHCGDWLFWFEMCQHGDVCEVPEKLNSYRQHSQKVTTESIETGADFIEMAHVQRIISDTLRLSNYQRKCLRGRQTKRILKAKRSNKKLLRLRFPDIYDGSWFDILLYTIDKMTNWSNLRR